MNLTKCWEALQGRSERDVEAARQGLARALDRVTQLESQQSRLETMRLDYQRRMAATEQEPHAISRSVAYRSFLAQIVTLLARVAADLESAQSVVAGARRELMRCEQEREKYELLLEREHAIEQARLDGQENRMLEEFAIGRFAASRRGG